MPSVVPLGVDTPIVQNALNPDALLDSTILYEYADTDKFSSTDNTPKQAKTLIKFDIVNLFPRFKTPVDEIQFSLKMGFETKLSQRLSLTVDAGMFKESFSLTDVQNIDYSPLNLFFRAGLRYYLNKKNLSLFGNYLAAEYQCNFVPSMFYSYYIYNEKPSVINNLSLSYGFQHKIAKKGYVDMNFGLRFYAGSKPEAVSINGQTQFESQTIYGIRPHYRLDLGFLLHESKEKNDNTQLDTRAFIEEKHLFKINLLDVFKSVELSSQHIKTSLNLDIAYEHKLFKSLSFLLGSKVSPTFYSARNPMQKTGTIVRFEQNLDLRWYFNLNRKILNGLGANNFSADYIAPTVSSRFFFSNVSELNSSEELLFANLWDFRVKYGIQRRIFKHGFFDFSFGLGSHLNQGYSNRVFVFSDVKLGLAF